MERIFQEHDIGFSAEAIERLHASQKSQASQASSELLTKAVLKDDEDQEKLEDELERPDPPNAREIVEAALLEN